MICFFVFFFLSCWRESVWWSSVLCVFRAMAADFRWVQESAAEDHVCCLQTGLRPWETCQGPGKTWIVWYNLEWLLKMLRSPTKKIYSLEVRTPKEHIFMFPKLTRSKQDESIQIQVLAWNLHAVFASVQKNSVRFSVKKLDSCWFVLV